jgi:hypothetical protein
MMAHTLGNTATTSGAANPVTLAVAPAAGTTLLVVEIMTVGGVYRTGGGPTFGGVALTNFGAAIHRVAPEGSVEIWYMLAPPTAGATLSIPNTATQTLVVGANQFVAGPGKKSKISSGSGTSALTANPRVAVTPSVDGAVIVSVMASGSDVLPTGRAGTNIIEQESGGVACAAQYTLQGVVAVWPAVGINNWTIGAEDWAAYTASFVEEIDTAQVTPELAVVTLLDALAALTRKVNLFEGPVRAQSATVPHQAVFVLPSGGPAPEAYADGTTTERRYSAIQITLRSDPKDYAGGWVLARQVKAALHHATVTGYVDIRAMQSEPIYVGPDEADRHLWSVNLELWKEV